MCVPEYFSCFFLISLNRERIAAIKFLFGTSKISLDDFAEENLKQIEELVNLVEAEANSKSASENHPSPHQVYVITRLFLLVYEVFLSFSYLISHSFSWVFRSRRLQIY